MHWGLSGTTGLKAVIGCGLLGLGMIVPAAAMVDTSGFASHRAIYDVRLGEGRNAAGFSHANGRIVVEWQNVCTGYTLNQRFVTEFVSVEGDALFTDARFSSWEDREGDDFRFSMERFFNDLPADGAVGTASRDDTSVVYERPMADTLDLPDDVIFPNEHAVAIVRAAEDGTKVVKRTVFNGAEDGAIYDAVAFIGPRQDARGDGPFQHIEGGEPLGSLPHWPVTLGYYAFGEKDAGLPVYEVSYHLYPNGVSDTLRLNYGDFELVADLSHIDFIETPDCL